MKTFNVVAGILLCGVFAGYVSYEYLTARYRPHSSIQKQYATVVSNVLVNQNGVVVPEVYKRDCEITEIKATRSTCDGDQFVFFVPGQKPLGKKYRVTIEELP